MNANDFKLVETEPPHPMASDGASAALVDRVMAVAHLPATAHVAVIGRHTLPLVLALMRHGCDSVCSLRPGAPSPDRQPADLAWIVDVANEDELDEALQAARGRAGKRGRVIVEGMECVCRNGLSALRDHAVAAGLEVVSFDHVAGRLVLAPANCLAMAA
jgi:hypothetical protein